MNKFGRPDEDYQNVAQKIKELAEAAQGLLDARAQCT
jgi:hypothetical protein